ncbi:MAG TPA: bifunctional phosphoglucose/phosphomannose isomerase [Actinomycetota bacterium]
MTTLDDLDRLARLDSEGVLGMIEQFSDQIRQGWELGLATPSLPDATGVDSIVVLGMGGSGVSGDVVQSVIEPRLPLSFRVIKSYGPLPEAIGRSSLVFAVSYSGNTEETLAAFEEAHSRGARAVAICSGGELAERAAAYGVAHVAIPPGRQPRASLGYLMLPILAVLQKVGLVPNADADVEEAIAVTASLGERCDRARSVSENPAKDLALRIEGKVPVVYGSYGPTATAAQRFKCDLNEYAKTPAFWNFIPELDHNEIVGWNRLAEMTRHNFVGVLLRDVEEPERIARRFEVTRSLIEDHLAEVVEVTAEGRSPLARVLSLIMLTQLGAIYLGLAYGVDPGPVDAIDKLKAELAKA